MYVNDIFAKGGGINKVYIALFKCDTRRAVHLELVPSLTAESFVKAVARFKGTWGTPTLIVSDTMERPLRTQGCRLIVSVMVQNGGSMLRQPLGGVGFFDLVNSSQVCQFKFEEVSAQCAIEL